MLDFCSKHNITSRYRTYQYPANQSGIWPTSEKWCKYRFVIDMASLKNANG
jgi:hypothetical protein